MTTPEVLIASGGLMIAGANALDAAMPYGLMMFGGRVRLRLAALMLVGICIALAGLVTWFWPHHCQPGTWDCAAFDGGKWSEQ